MSNIATEDKQRKTTSITSMLLIAPQIPGYRITLDCIGEFSGQTTFSKGVKVATVVLCSPIKHAKIS